MHQTTMRYLIEFQIVNNIFTCIKLNAFALEGGWLDLGSCGLKTIFVQSP